MSRDDILRALRSEFRDNTRERLTEMSELLTKLKSTPDKEQLSILERHFHGLAGLGGTYGYDSVTLLSREAEDICDRGSAFPDFVDYERLRTILSRLAGAIEEAPDNE